MTHRPICYVYPFLTLSAGAVYIYVYCMARCNDIIGYGFAMHAWHDQSNEPNDLRSNLMRCHTVESECCVLFFERDTLQYFTVWIKLNYRSEASHHWYWSMIRNRMTIANLATPWLCQIVHIIAIWDVDCFRYATGIL